MRCMTVSVRVEAPSGNESGVNCSVGEVVRVAPPFRVQLYMGASNDRFTDTGELVMASTTESVGVRDRSLRRMVILGGRVITMRRGVTIVRLKDTGEHARQDTVKRVDCNGSAGMPTIDRLTKDRPAGSAGEISRAIGAAPM